MSQARTSQSLLQVCLQHHSQEIIPARRSFRVPTERSLTETLEEPADRTLLLGRAYEAMTAALHGEELADLKRVEELYDPEIPSRPDVIDRQRNIVGESKACYVGKRVALQSSQIEHYTSLQCSQPDLQIYYAIYRHPIAGIKTKWEGTPKDLFSELARGTVYGLVLPFREVCKTNVFRILLSLGLNLNKNHTVLMISFVN